MKAKCASMTFHSSKSSIFSGNETYAQAYEVLKSKYRSNQPNIDYKSVESHFKEKSITLAQTLAYGPNSVVYLGQLSSGRMLALKIILKRSIKELGGSLIKRSIDYQKVHKSDKIASVHEFASINESYMSLVIDFYPDGSLAKFLETSGPLQENIAQGIFKMILQGLSYLHMCKIAHRNLKLENVLLDKRMVPVLADFSASIVVENNSNWEFLMATSLPYLAPEILSKVPYDPIIADIWSFGVCLFSSLNDCLPFGSSGKPEKSNTALNYKPQVEQSLSEPVKKCINDALQFDVNKRATAFSLQSEQWFIK